MLQIRCPHCGVRDEVEFRDGGESGIERPDPSVSDDRWARYLYFRKNVKGQHTELWCHDYGCKKWFGMVRDTATHEIVRTFALNESVAEGASKP